MIRPSSFRLLAVFLGLGLGAGAADAAALKGAALAKDAKSLWGGAHDGAEGASRADHKLGA